MRRTEGRQVTPQRAKSRREQTLEPLVERKIAANGGFGNCLERGTLRCTKSKAAAKDGESGRLKIHQLEHETGGHGRRGKKYVRIRRKPSTTTNASRISKALLFLLIQARLLQRR
jgi:hypothetical protein